MGPSVPKRVSSSETGGKRNVVVRVWLLGGFRVSVGSRTIPQDAWRLRKAAALVKLLALAPGHRMHREQLMDLLWPDSATRTASNNLRQVVYAARKVLDPSSNSSGRYLSLTDEQVFLCPDGQLWVDVETFEGAAATARRSRDPAAYRMALELYAGDLLPEDRYEEWAVGRREGLRQLYLALLIELASLYEVRDEHASAIEALRKATEEDPTLEEAHASLMRLHALSGRPERALAQYARLHDALQKDMGTQPTEATRRVHDEIAAHRFSSPPPIDDRPRREASGAGTHNLPAQRTSFVGREREMVDVKRALSMTRLLTLTGTGGTGKTRLALEVARDLIGSYLDGVWLVELASLSEPGLVAQEAANVLGVQERPGDPLTDTLVEALAAKEMLLVLDNCEHVVEAAARLVDKLLVVCPRLRVLATSRETLDVSGEVVWAVPPLSLPGDTTNGGLTTETLGRYEAVRLFLDRARLRSPDFGLTRENAGAVARVCRKLEGIQLAIELATARMGALAVEQVAQRLEVSLDVLKGTSRSAAPRQRTLRATLDWSHDLLSEDERTLFRRLSVFTGGWVLEAAEAVGAGSGIEEGLVANPGRASNPPVLDLLSGLVDKSLVVAEADGDGALRYRLLETVRQYATEKLGSGAEEEAVRQRHAMFFLALAERAEPELGGTEQVAWLDRLESELSNLRVALGWFKESARGMNLLRMAGSLWRFCYLRGHYEEGRRWLEGALVGGDNTPSPARAKAYLGAGAMTFRRCEYERGREQLEEAVATYRMLEDDQGIASASHMLGSIAGERGDYARSEALHEESLVLRRRFGDEAGEAQALNYLAYVAWLQEKHERAKELGEETLSRFRRLGDNEIIAWALINLGSSALYAGDHPRARALLGESLALSREVGFKEGVPWSLNQLGVLAYREGDHRWAQELLRESLEGHQDLGDRWRAASVLEVLAEVMCAQGRPEPAACLFGAAAAVREAITVPVPLCERADHEEGISATRAELGEAAWEAAFAEGKAMTFEEVVEYALSMEEPDPSTRPIPRVPPTDEPVSSLTRREREVATLVARGLTNRQISTELSISERTASNHVAKVLKKLGLASRVQIVSWAAEGPLPPSRPD